MTDENKKKEGLQFTINHGGQETQPTEVEPKKEKIEEEKDNGTIENTKSGTRRKG